MKHQGLGPITAIANQKGGVGKTTTSINLAASLAALEKRVLLIDLDPQGNSTSGLGVNQNTVRSGTYDVLMGDAQLSDAIIATDCERLLLLPASMDLAGAEIELVSELGRELRLEQAFAAYKGEAFDYVFIDCPPALSLLTVNALSASDHVMVTLQTEFYAMEGLTQLMDSIRRIKQALNSSLTMEGILLTMVDGRNRLSTQVEEDVRAYFGSQVYANTIPRNVRLSEAPSFGVPVMYHDVRSKGAQAYLVVAQEFMHRREIQ
ncbi:ParA family protein [Mariprofundus ferrooxydans]|uniref:ParA, ParA family ATPase n=1 Tax=Mariprofundus ferrooxydans PV-1 TaxID=314345 RepID=Q0EVX9_9PROT|nr:ParA, ParA family ATPase [Mariprofundus ferrooxydans PV-1]KON47618.1 chromosome partitioning protein ParA [Mariprofundus ferrooxydans]